MPPALRSPAFTVLHRASIQAVALLTGCNTRNFDVMACCVLTLVRLLSDAPEGLSEDIHGGGIIGWDGSTLVAPAATREILRSLWSYLSDENGRHFMVECTSVGVVSA